MARAAGRVIVADVDAAAVLCDRCELAETPWRRLRGLLGRRGLASGEGLILRPASAIHTCFMRFAIDVVFLDAAFRVLEIRADVPPWRACAVRGARAVLELPAGQARRCGLEPGAELMLAVRPGKLAELGDIAPTGVES